MVLFFFQTEDGIRDIGVTGVQTCALPIVSSPTSESSASRPCSRPVPRTVRPSSPCTTSAPIAVSRRATTPTGCQLSDRKRVVEGKSGDIGSGPYIKKKKIEE